VLGIYTYTQPVTAERVFFKQNFAHVRVNKGTPEEVTIAKQVDEAFVSNKDMKMMDPAGFPFNVVQARRYIRLEHRDPVIPLNVVCVGFGEVAFLGLPGEPFTEMGRQIKEGSPFTMTIPCCNANGSEGYFPTDEALLENGYEATSSLFLPGVAPELVRVALTTLHEVKK